MTNSRNRTLLVHSTNEARAERLEAASTDDTEESDYGMVDRYNFVYGLVMTLGAVVGLVTYGLPYGCHLVLKSRIGTDHFSRLTNYLVFVDLNMLIAPGVILSFVNMLTSQLGNIQKRVFYALIACSMVLMFQMVLATFKYNEWSTGYIVLCWSSLLIVYGAASLINSCLFHVVSFLPVSYMNALVIGHNIGGILRGILMSFFTLKEELDMSSVMKFLFIILWVLIVGLLAFNLLVKTIFYQYQYQKIAESSNKTRICSQMNTILKKALILLCSVVINVASSWSIRQYSFDATIVNTKEATPAIVWHFFLIIGNLLKNSSFLKSKPRFVLLPVILNSGLVIFYRVLEESLKTDSLVFYVTNALSLVSVLLQGYLHSFLVTFTPRVVKPELASHAAMWVVFAMSIGDLMGYVICVSVGLILGSK